MRPKSSLCVFFLFLFSYCAKESIFNYCSQLWNTFFFLFFSCIVSAQTECMDNFMRCIHYFCAINLMKILKVNKISEQKLGRENIHKIIMRLGYIERAPPKLQLFCNRNDVMHYRPHTKEPTIFLLLAFSQEIHSKPKYNERTIR